MFTSKDPIRSAQALDDSKIEYMFKTIKNLLNLTVNKKNGNTKFTKTLSKWMQANYRNYMWILDFYLAINEERYKRFNKKDNVDFDYITYRHNVPRVSVIVDEFPNLTQYSDILPYLAYRKTFEEEWNNDEEIPNWTNRNPPIWSWRHPRNVDKFGEVSYNKLEI